MDSLLSNDLLYRIFGELDVADATRFSSCSSLCYKIGLDEHAWRARALSMWPLDTVSLCPHSPYATYRELVLDNNRHGVDWHLPLQRCASLYKYNRDHAYYECKLLHLEWNRLNDTLSIYFDARGESDLRHPMQSSLIITTPVRDGQPLSSKHVLFSLQATSAQLLTSTEAHYKGCLTFDGCAAIGHRLANETCTVDQQAIQQSGMELWFVYANQLPFSALQGRPPPTRFVWGSQFLDHEPALLLPVPVPPTRSSLPSERPWSSGSDAEAAAPLVAALAARCKPVVPGSTLRALRDERRADEASRWSDLPENVAQRGLWGQ